MLASLNGNEEMGVKKEAFCPSHNFFLALLRLFFVFVLLIQFWKVMPDLNGPFSPGDRENA